MSKGCGFMVMDLDKNDEMVGVMVNYGNFVIIEGIGCVGKIISVMVEGVEFDGYCGKCGNKGVLLVFKVKLVGISQSDSQEDMVVFVKFGYIFVIQFVFS